MTPELKDDLNEILRSSLKVTGSMIEIACAREWFVTAQAMIEFKARLVQGVDVKRSLLTQVPQFTQEDITKFQTGAGAAKTLVQFLGQASEERKGLADMSAGQKQDIDAFCNHVALCDLNGKIEVEDEDAMCAGDIATVTATLTRKNLSEGQAAGPVHA